MNYDDDVVAFLAEKENLPLALEIAGKIERVKDKLQRDFWLSLLDTLTRKLHDHPRNTDWEAGLINENDLLAEHAGCSVRPKYLPRGGKKCLEVAVQQERSHLFVSIKWHDDAKPAVETNNVKSFKDRLREEKYLDVDDWCIGWKWLNWFLRTDDFLIKMVSDKTALTAEVADFVWRLFERYSVSINNINDEISQTKVDQVLSRGSGTQ